MSYDAFGALFLHVNKTFNDYHRFFQYSNIISLLPIERIRPLITNIHSVLYCKAYILVG